MKKIFLFVFALLICSFANAEVKKASVSVDSNTRYQKITGFGGFVCSSQFGYNWMTTDEIKKLWGKDSEAGYNIMRLYIPSVQSAWSQSLETAKLAKSLGLIVFASPWTMPTEWKTYNIQASQYKDNSGVEHDNYLQEAHYGDYADYLNQYVLYLRQNGVELDAISIQNEPDMRVDYAGCIWTPAQLSSFIKNYGNLISCKIITPETIGMTDDYANPLLAEDVIDKVGIYAGHQYGAIQNGFQQLQAKGKDAWMTEYLINWTADEPVARNFDWQKDAFNFVGKLNSALLANVNAWIYYTAKRYYGLLGDGLYGTANSMITKRGYILSQYAKNTIGSTRIKADWNDDSNTLQGSSFISQTGDSVIVMVINPSSDTYALTLDLPFFTKAGKCIQTTASVSMSASDLTIDSETYRPEIDINASSLTTLIFAKSSERPVSQMTGSPVYYNTIEEQKPTSANFGSAWQLSGKTVTFDHSNNLISPNLNANNGYLKLNDNFNRLVFNIKSITSTSTYTTSSTTLYYVNAAGNLKSYNYGTLTYVQNGSSQWSLDISNNVLTDGCTGIIGISCGNYTSILTIQFGDVYFAVGNEKGYKFQGVYSHDDSNLLNCLEDSSYTSLDFTETTGIPAGENWQAEAANKNCLYYIASDVSNNNPNIISGNHCSRLLLTGDEEGANNFFAAASFIAESASLSLAINGYEMLVLPFEAAIPDGLKAYAVQPSASDVTCTLISDNKIPANTPVLINGSGTFTFTGSGEVSMPETTQDNGFHSVYIAQEAPVNSYILHTEDNISSFNKITTSINNPTVMPFKAYLVDASASALQLPLKLVEVTSIPWVVVEKEKDNILYDIMGNRVYHPQKNIVYIYKDGRKVIFY